MNILDIFSYGEVQKLTEILTFLKSESYLNLDYELIRTHAKIPFPNDDPQHVKAGKKKSFTFNFYLEGFYIACNDSNANLCKINIEINDKMFLREFNAYGDNEWVLNQWGGIQLINGILPFFPVKRIYKNPFYIQILTLSEHSSNVYCDIYFLGFRLPDSKVN